MGVDAEEVKGRRQYVFGGDRGILHLSAVRVALPHNVASSYAAGGEHGGIYAPPVVTARPRPVWDQLGCPPMFTQAQHERFVQKAAGIQVVDEGGVCAVESG